jgi:diguanylate cyclase (GGDEF)-like protein
VRNPRTGLAANESWSPPNPTPARDAPSRQTRRAADPAPAIVDAATLRPIQQLIDLNPNGMVVVDDRGTVLLHNSRAAALLAIHPDDLLGGRFRHRWDASEATTVEVRDDHGVSTILEIRASALDLGAAPAYAVMLTPEHGFDLALRDELGAGLHDELTGLPGREAFLNRVHEAMKGELDPERRIAVVRIDLDQFRRINDFYGPSIADRVLQGVANRLATAVRPQDYVGRLSGDDFVVLLPEETLGEQLRVAQRVLDGLKQPFDLEGHAMLCHPTVALARHQGDESEEELLTAAEVALVGDRVDGTGSGGVAVGEGNDAGSRHLATVNRSLTRALAEDQLYLLYQPVFNLRDGEIVALEALVRWEHPDDGLISPGEFIRMADQSGVIISLGEWVLSEVVDQILEWRERRPDAVVPPISINVTGRQLVYPGFRRHALTTLARRGLDPSAIRFEITETALMERRARVDEVLTELGGDGFELDLDDFGTGLSSLTHLREFPISAIKLDGSFVRRSVEDGRSRQLIEAAVQAAHAFEVAVVAEGVETEEQKSLMTRWGCDLAQGYLLARPLNAAEAARFFVSKGPQRGPLLRSQGLLRRQV